MAYVVPRPNLTWKEKIYLPSIVAGLFITIKHLKRMLSGQTKVVMQYPEEKWDSHMPEHYRGAPTLVKDEHGGLQFDAPALADAGEDVAEVGEAGAVDP